MTNARISFLGGMVLGAALGVVTGLLAAPASGTQTRKKLKKKSRKYSNDAIQAVRQYLAGVSGQGSGHHLGEKVSRQRGA